MRVIIKGSVQWCAVMLRTKSLLQRDPNPKFGNSKSGEISSWPCVVPRHTAICFMNRVFCFRLYQVCPLPKRSQISKSHQIRIANNRFTYYDTFVKYNRLNSICTKVCFRLKNVWLCEHFELLGTYVAWGDLLSKNSNTFYEFKSNMSFETYLRFI